MANRRRGYTLVEVGLVAAVLVIVGFISLPYLQPMLMDSRLHAATDHVKARWAEARRLAMAEGRPYRFAVKEGSGNFRIAPDSPEFWGDSGSSNIGSGPGMTVQGELPGDVLFCNRGGTAAQADAAGGSWMAAATFLPDGSAREDVVVTFGKQGSRPVTLRLNGVTGAVSSGTAEEGR